MKQMHTTFAISEIPVLVGRGLRQDSRPGPIAEHGGKALGRRALPRCPRPFLSRAFCSSVILFTMILALGCVAPTIRQSVLVPAGSREVSQFRRFAVIPFSGQDGFSFSQELESAMAGVRVQDEPYFRILERSALAAITREQGLQLSGSVDERTAVTVGKLAGAEAMILGTITAARAEDSYFSEGRTKCTATDNRGRCVQTQRYSVSCTRRQAVFSFTPKIIAVATGQIITSITSDRLESRVVDRACQDSGSLASNVELLGRAKRQSLDKFIAFVAPHYVTVELTLLDSDNTKPSVSAQEALKRGVVWAREGRLDRACELFDEAHQLHRQGWAIVYNLGVCAELSGDLRKALNHYRSADRMAQTPVRHINTAIERVTRQLTGEQELQRQLRAPGS